MKRPLGNRVIVKPNDSITVSSTGMELPADSIDKPMEGIAVAVGKCEDVKQGDKVTYGKYAGMPITIDEVDYLIMKESEILAVE